MYAPDYLINDLEMNLEIQKTNIYATGNCQPLSD